MTQLKLNPVHPGKILFGEFLQPMGISQNILVHAKGGALRRIHEIVLEKQSISVDPALPLGQYFENTENSGWVVNQIAT
jgi:addiction module HigA family antidote